MDADLKTVYVAGLATLTKMRNRALSGQPLSPSDALAVIRFADLLRNELAGYRPEPLQPPDPIPAPPVNAAASKSSGE